MAILNTNKSKLVEVSPNTFKNVGYIRLNINSNSNTVTGICYESKEVYDKIEENENAKFIHDNVSIGNTMSFGEIETDIESAPSEKMHALAIEKLGKGFEVVGLKIV